LLIFNDLLIKSIDHGKSELSRIDYLDGWRGIAIAFVLIAHFFRVKEIDIGRMGVDIFFVLSGMLMSKILFVKKVPLKIFYKRRISRILPVFFIYLTVISLCSLAFGLSGEHWNYIYNLFFLRAYYPENPDLWHTGLPVGHLWSLNIEEHSYIVLSIIAFFSTFFKRAYFVILVLGVGSIIVRYLYIKFPEVAPPSYYLRTEVVANFIFISAGYYLIKSNFDRFIPPWAPILTFVLAFIFYSPYSPHWSAKWLLAPFLLAFTVNHLNLLPAVWKKMLSVSVLRVLGLWSFSIYLWQQPLYFYGTKHGYAFPYAGVTLFLAAILMGAISFYYIENPIRKYLNDKW